MIKHCFLTAAAVLALVAHGQKAAGQTPVPVNVEPQAPSAAMPVLPPRNPGLSSSGTALQLLLDFKDSDIKFKLETLMNLLKDKRHEGWVLAAYPDPKTNRPLIGAGFSLDLEERAHPQRDPLNQHPFIEPSSAELWQAAGLEPERLQVILDHFDENLRAWGKKNYRRKIRLKTLSPDVTEEEADKLLRISAIQAIQNAKAYCREFDQLTASQQMALSQLVFQMGVNLEEFVQFLGSLNRTTDVSVASPSSGDIEETERWKTVQRALIQSQWAKLYTNRAASVIAMFDPDYVQHPSAVEREVKATIRPVVRHRRKKTHLTTARFRNTAALSRKCPARTCSASSKRGS